MVHGLGQARAEEVPLDGSRPPDCPGARWREVAPASHVDESRPEARAAPCSCVLVKQKKLVVNSIMNVLVRVQPVDTTKDLFA